MSIMQGGSGFPFLAEPVYRYMCTGESTGIVVSNDQVPDHTLRFVLDKVWIVFVMIIVLLICMLFYKDQCCRN